MNNTLQWKFHDDGSWEANSSMPGEGAYGPNIVYWIQVCDDGSFDLSRSDAVLDFKGFPCLGSLGAAKACCEVRETQVKAMAK